MKIIIITAFSLISLNSFADWSLGLRSKSVHCLGSDAKGTVELFYSKAIDAEYLEPITNIQVKIDGLPMKVDSIRVQQTLIGAYGADFYAEFAYLMNGKEFKSIAFQSPSDSGSATSELISKMNLNKEYVLVGELSISPRIYKTECKVSLHDICEDAAGNIHQPCSGRKI